jgi:glutamate N-acetyltransferase/amino-acid N-acetyltransferase
VLPFSTGVIMEPLPVAKIVDALPAAHAALAPDHWFAAVSAMMTTDIVAKGASRLITVDGFPITVTGIAKGSGMIHPDMATLLALVTTDAPVAPGVLQPLLRRVTDQTFNCVTVDGDTSTNDTLLMLANGAAGGEPVGPGSGGLAALETAVLEVCDQLAEMIAADGEGATRHFRVEVRGAATVEQARLAARTVAGSPLVKTAVHGCDPNWGRIVAAVGRSGAEFVLDGCRVVIGGVPVFDAGAPVDADLEAIRRIFAARRVDLEIDLGAGDAIGHAWGCDLSDGYVRINADYTT